MTFLLGRHESDNITLFPLPLMPERGEIFSSWVARVALNHRITLNYLLKYLYGGSIFLKRDIDKYVSIDVVKKMASVVNAEVKDAKSTSLLLYSFPASNIDSNVYNAEWITHVNNIYTKRSSYGLCFCPQCFQEDEFPYFRLSWRYSFVTLCAKHKCLLYDECPFCGVELNIYRIPATSDSLGACWRCGGILGNAAPCHSYCFDSYFEQQRFMEQLLVEAHGDLEAEQLQKREYFIALYNFTHYIMHRYHAQFPHAEVWRHGSFEMHSNFDCYSVINRMIILDIASSCYDDIECNFKAHLQLVASNHFKQLHRRTKSPCESWCIDHDYLKLNKTCVKVLGDCLSERLSRQQDRFQAVKSK